MNRQRILLKIKGRRSPSRRVKQSLTALDRELSANKLDKWVLLARKANFNCKRLAALLGKSLRQLERVCKEELGRSTEAWLCEQRMVAARGLLGTKSVKEVSAELGFKHTSHFCRCFKAAFGLRPTEFAHKFKLKHLTISPLGNGNPDSECR